jgi:hypothetical protein
MLGIRQHILGTGDGLRIGNRPRPDRDLGVPRRRLPDIRLSAQRATRKHHGKTKEQGFHHSYADEMADGSFNHEA